MPLPSSGSIWPPASMQAVYNDIRANDSWLIGTGPGGGAVASGLMGQIRNIFGNRAAAGVAHQIHVPIAKSIARMSASVLFGEMFKATFANDKDADDDMAEISEADYIALTKRVGELLNDHAHSALLEGAELAAAHCGVYYRVSWDKEIEPNGAFITVRAADTAIPTFRFGRLVNVIFWDKLATVAQLQYTLLEMHERGTISWGLYESPANDTLGKQVPMSAHPDTIHFLETQGATINGLTVSIATGTDRLTAAYMPNSKPNLGLRHDPIASVMGRSDFDQAGALFSMLDDVMTSWERDFRLGKTRVMIPKDMLKMGQPGQGASFDNDQELFVQLNGTGLGAMNTEDGGKPFQVIQPDIRSDVHRASAEYLFGQIYSTTGYSAQSFGESGDTAKTATEIAAREKQTLSTRANKIVIARPVMADLICALIDVDNFVFPERGVARKGLDPQIEFPDVVGEDPQVEAQTLLTLVQAEALSYEQRVRRLHDEWDDAAVAKEVALIKAENGIDVNTDAENIIDPIDSETDAAVPAANAPVVIDDEVTN